MPYEALRREGGHAQTGEMQGQTRKTVHGLPL